MKRYLIIAAVLAIVSFSYVPSAALAQDEEEGIEFSWGIVSSISSSQIVIREYNFDREEEVETTYMLDPDVELRNIDSLKNISVGDDVEIEYVIEGNQKIVKTISLEACSDDFLSSGAYEEQQN